MRSAVLLVFLLVLTVPGLAEVIDGTVTQVDEDRGRVTLVRSDTGDTIDVAIADTNALSLAQAGGSITVDASASADGSFTAPTLQTLANAGTPQATDPSPVVLDTRPISTGLVRGPAITEGTSGADLEATDSVPGSTGTGASMASSTAADGSPSGSTSSGSAPPDSVPGSR